MNRLLNQLDSEVVEDLTNRRDVFCFDSYLLVYSLTFAQFADGGVQLEFVLLGGFSFDFEVMDYFVYAIFSCFGRLLKVP